MGLCYMRQWLHRNRYGQLRGILVQEKVAVACRGKEAETVWCNQLVSLDAIKYRSCNTVNTEGTLNLMQTHAFRHSDWLVSKRQKQAGHHQRQASSHISVQHSDKVILVDCHHTSLLHVSCGTTCWSELGTHTTQGPQRCMAEDQRKMVARPVSQARGEAAAAPALARPPAGRGSTAMLQWATHYWQPAQQCLPAPARPPAGGGPAALLQWAAHHRQPAQQCPPAP